MSTNTTFAHGIKAKLCGIELTPRTVAAFGCGLLFANADCRREHLLRTEFSEALTPLQYYYREKTGRAMPVSFGERKYKLSVARDPFAPRKPGRRQVTVYYADPIEESERALQAVFGLWSVSADGKLTLDERVLQNKARAAAFLRGLFVARGIVNPPEKEYHLEFFGLTPAQAEAVNELLVAQGFAGATTRRGERCSVYFKDGEQVEYLLALLGDNDAMFQVANQRIARDMSNQLNRQMNCDVANLAKSRGAAARQIADIRLLYEKGVIHTLPDSLKETAEIRLANEDASLAELARILGLGRSGVNHRLEKLTSLAQELREREAK